MIPTLKFEGGQELQKALEQLPARVSKRIQLEALIHAAEPMRRSMGIKAPHEPGKPDIKDEIVINRVKGEDAQETAVAIGPSKAGWYGSFQELGTAHHPPQRFAGPAFEENVGKALQRLAADIWVSLAARGVPRASVLTAAAAVMGEEV